MSVTFQKMGIFCEVTLPVQGEHPKIREVPYFGETAIFLFGFPEGLLLRLAQMLLIVPSPWGERARGYFEHRRDRGSYALGYPLTRNCCEHNFLRAMFRFEATLGPTFWETRTVSRDYASNS